MLPLESLFTKPRAFVSLTGFTPAAFEGLFGTFAPAYPRHRATAHTTRRGRQPRRRAPGGGAPHAWDRRHRLLLALVWLKVYPTFAVLGRLFGLDKGNARRNLLEILEVLDDFPFDHDPTTGWRRPGRSPGSGRPSRPCGW